MFSFFFFNDTATTEIYTLSLHDALPISMATLRSCLRRRVKHAVTNARKRAISSGATRDRKSTRLNSSHLVISYAVFCLKKKQDKSCQQISPAHTSSPDVCRDHSPALESD